MKIPPLNLNSTRDSPPLGTKFNLQAQVDDLCSSGCKQRQVFVSWHQDLVKEEIFILALRENHVITRHNSACRCDVCVSCIQITDIWDKNQATSQSRKQTTNDPVQLGKRVKGSVQELFFFSRANRKQSKVVLCWGVSCRTYTCWKASTARVFSVIYRSRHHRSVLATSSYDLQHSAWPAPRMLVQRQQE